jgi:uncharacterized RDD family membrane protein YckC
MEDTTDVLGRRIGAALLDILLMAVLFVVVGLLIGDSSSDDGNVSVNLEGGPAAVYFALVLLYYGITEAVTGQTIGKRLLGIRVARVDGSRAGGGAIAVRTLLRIVDVLPLAYFVGFVCVLVTGQRRQRLGDLAAGTRVVPA